MGLCTFKGSGASPGLCSRGSGPFRNKDFTRRPPVRRLSGLLDAVVDGVCGCFRRKSVRISPTELGCGSEILPNDEPLRLRAAAFLRLAPRIQTLARESNIPRARPGKNPARTAVTGNFAHTGDTTNGVSVGEGVFVEGDDVVVEEVLIDVVELDVGELEIALDEDGIPGAFD